MTPAHGQDFPAGTDILCGVKQDERAPFDRALQRARASAYAPDEFVEQESLMRARERARELPCRFEVAQIPPIPPGPFDVVLLLETMLAFPDKQPLLDEIAGALPTGGRLGFTLEEGLPLTEAERKRMPDADTVWLTPLDEMLDGLEQAGLAVRWQEDFSRPHRAIADSLSNAFAADAAEIAAQIGRQALDGLLAAHRLWSDWLQEGRVRKLALVAEKA